MPAFGPEQSGDPSITVSTVLAGQADDIRRQRVLVRSANPHLTLGRAVLANDATGSAFRYVQCLLDMINTLPAAGGA